MGEMIGYATANKVTGPWTYQGILTAFAERSYTIHSGIAEFKGQSYFFYHNATLTLNGQRGALGRRAVGVEYLFYNPDGTIQPIRQTKEGVSVPPQRALDPVRTAFTLTPSTPAASDPGVKVTTELGADPTAWLGQPVLSTVNNPYDQASKAVSFNAHGRPSSIGQTFKMESDLQLARAVLYAGDGFGATSEEPVTLALYDLGEGEASPDLYPAQANLLGNGQGLKIAYSPQARGLLQIDFSGGQRAQLKKGHVYAFELQGKPNSAPLFWRRSTKESFGGGAAYSDRKRLKDGESFCDFAIALYG
jgi:hypothetical protein